MAKNPYALKKGCVGITDIGDPRVQKEMAWAEGHKAGQQDLMQWLHGPCPHGIGDFHRRDKVVTMCFRKDCPECMVAKRKELGL